MNVYNIEILQTMPYFLHTNFETRQTFYYTFDKEFYGIVLTTSVNYDTLIGFSLYKSLVSAHCGRHV